MKPEAFPTYRLPKVAGFFRTRLWRFIPAALVILACLGLAVSGLTPRHASGRAVPVCFDATQMFQVPCFAGCAIADPADGEFSLERFLDACCSLDAEPDPASSVPVSCFCCTGSPFRIKYLKTRLTVAAPGQPIPALQPGGTIPSAVPGGAWETSWAGTVGLSDHLPLRATVVIIV